VLSQMMNRPLMISSLIRHADKNHGDTETVSRIQWHSGETQQEHNSCMRWARENWRCASDGSAPTAEFGMVNA
jgi:hypothetical protein